MMEVVPYIPKHLDQIEVKACHFSEVPKLILTEAVTLLSEGTPVAIIGAFVFIPGVVHVWALVSEHARKKPLEFHRTCLRLLAQRDEKDPPRRIQLEVRVDYPEGIKWAQLLGFHVEGTMRRFGPDGSDHVLLARVH